MSVSSEPEDGTADGLTFGPPALLATSVENFWMRSPSETVRLERHLDEALWLGYCVLAPVLRILYFLLMIYWSHTGVVASV